jgi:hypothetical protein
LFILAILLMAAGFAVGLMNMFSPGTVTVGLNYDVAATLFTGGLPAARPRCGCRCHEQSVPQRRTSRLRATVRCGSAQLMMVCQTSCRPLVQLQGQRPPVLALLQQALGSAAESAAGSAADMASDAGSAIADTAASATDVVADTASAAAGTAGDALSGASAKAAGWASETKDDLSSLFDRRD